jgi:hypothetical protein
MTLGVLEIAIRYLKQKSLAQHASQVKHHLSSRRQSFTICHCYENYPTRPYIYIGSILGQGAGKQHLFDCIYYLSLQYRNKFKSQLTSPTPAQLPAVALSAGHICVVHLFRRAFAGRHVFVLASSSGLRGHKRTYLTILESADHALFKLVRYVLLRPLRPELDAKTKTCLPAKTRFCHLYPVHLLAIPMYICTSQSLFSHSYVVNE